MPQGEPAAEKQHLALLSGVKAHCEDTEGSQAAPVTGL